MSEPTDILTKIDNAIELVKRYKAHKEQEIQALQDQLQIERDAVAEIAPKMDEFVKSLEAIAPQIVEAQIEQDQPQLGESHASFGME